MLVDLSEVVLDADAGSCFTVLRQSPGLFGAGGWKPGAIDEIAAFGIVSIADAKALQMVPEGDRVVGSLSVIWHQPLFVTQAQQSAQGQGITSDVIQYNGQRYRVQSVQPWIMAGFWAAICVREKGA